MKVVMCLVALTAAFCTVESKITPPKVQVYSRDRGEFGMGNTLICHVSGFHPPHITIDFWQNGRKLGDAQQTDLAFNKNWQFHLTKNVDFTPMREDKYICRVTHGQTVHDFAWDPDM